MEFSVAREVFVFFACCLSGICIGMVYDLFRIIRSFAETSPVLTDSEDLLFWGIASVILFFVIFRINRGIVRFYELIGAFCGAILYFFLFGKAFRFLIRQIICIFLKIFSFFCKILLTPLRFMYNIIDTSVLFVVGVIRRIIRAVAIRLKKRSKAMKMILTKK